MTVDRPRREPCGEPRRRPRPRAAAAAVTASLLLGGCSAGGGGAAAGGAPELTIWTDQLKYEAVLAVAEQFGEEQGIEVEVEAVSSELQSAFVTANAAGNGPDVVVGAHDWIGNLVQNGAIEALPLNPEELSAYDETAIEATTYAGQLYGVPYGAEAVALYRNTDVVPEEPATLDAAIAAGRRAVAEGQVESALNLPVGQEGDAYHMEALLTSGGGYLFGTDEEGYDAADLGIGQPGSLAAAERIGELGERGEGVLRRSISGDNAIALFAAGDAAFLISGPWALADLEGAGLPYAVQPVPPFEGADPAVPFMGAQAFMVAANGENKAYAQEFVTRGVNNEEAMTTLYDLAGLPPAMLSVAEAVAAEDPTVEVFTQAYQGGAPMPALPAMAAVWEPLGQAYSAIVGGADPAATMRTAGETISSAIGD
ncbi:sugar ABC transporter substrate-binding protein [Nocardioides nanhaiensis]|uniref:Extracellular solute-binding protein n=1 Tax=Nocardioides nanhaiensis TaxID=1476871 RepID=A0ABP8W3D2_9ACTN